MGYGAKTAGEKNRIDAMGQPVTAALLTAGLLSVLYLIKGMYPFGGGSIMTTDLYSQYVPLLYRFYDVVSGEKNLFMDFHVSGGANLYVDTINEVLNPFNYLLFLFGRERIYLAVNVLLLCYMAASAASANFLLLKLFPQNRRWNVALSLCYALCGYTAYNYQIIKWMYFPVLFPLFVRALYRLFAKGQGRMYALLLGYQLVLSVQLGFMTLLATLFGSGIYFWFYKNPKKPQAETHDGSGDCTRAQAVCRLGFYTAAGVCLSGAVLWPGMRILLSSSRAGENLSYFAVMRRHGLDDLFERLFQIGHPVLWAILLWLLAGRLRKREKGARIWTVFSGRERFFLVLYAWFLLTVLLQPANLLWHMGSYVCFPVRYAYMVVLAQVCLVKCLLVRREEETAGKKAEPAKAKRPGTLRERLFVLWGLGGVCLCGTALALAFLWEERIVQAFHSLAISAVCPVETAQVCLLLGLLFTAALCGCAFAGTDRAYRERGMVVPVMACGLCLYTFLLLPSGNAVRQANEEAYREMNLQAAKVKETGPGGSGQEEELLRHEKEDPALPLNAPLVNRKSSLGGYFPTADRGFQQAMEALGYLTPWVATRQVGGTAVSDAVLSGAMVLETEETQTWGESMSVLERQEKLAALAGQEDCLERRSKERLQPDADGNLHLLLDGERTVYLDLNRTAGDFTLWVNGEELALAEADARFSPHRLVELGTFLGDEITITVRDRNGAVVSAENMEAGILDRDTWEQAFEKRRCSAALQTKAGERKGEIRVTLDGAAKGQLVFLPVAALEGWRCSVNRKEAEPVTVFGGFLGIFAEEGRNEIRLSFVPPGLFCGVCLTLLGLIGIVWPARRLPLARRLSGALFGVLFAGGLLAVYVVPAAGLMCYLAWRLSGMGG